MAILKVARLGHPILRKGAKNVSASQIKTKEFRQFIQDMVDTMHEYEGVGLAAPQVHQSVRVCIIEIEEENPRYKKRTPFKLHVFINPKLEILDKDTNAYWEGCLSVPGLRGLVARPNKVQVKYLDENGKSKTLKAEGFLATVLQHEFDHLDGILYTDKLVDSKHLAFDQEFTKYILADAGEPQEE